MTTDVLSDEELVEQIRDGCAEALGELWSRHRQMLRRYVAARMSCPSQVEDIVSDAFLRAWQNLDKFSGGNVEAWLTRIAGNLALDHHKSGARRFETVTDAVPDTVTAALSGTVPEIYEAQRRSVAQAELVSRLLASMGEDQARCLTLRFHDDRTVAETAVALGRTAGAVKLLQHRAMAAARAAATSEELAACGIPAHTDGRTAMRGTRHRISVQNRPDDQAFKKSETTGPRTSAWVTRPRCPSS